MKRSLSFTKLIPLFALLGLGCSRFSNRDFTTTQQIIGLLPQDTSMWLSVTPSRDIISDAITVYRQALEETKADASIKKFGKDVEKLGKDVEQACGLTIQKIDGIFVAAASPSGVVPDALEEYRKNLPAVAMVRGDFKASMLEQCGSKLAPSYHYDWAVEQYGNHKMYKISLGPETVWAAMPSGKGLVVIANRNRLELVLDVYDKKQKSALENKEFVELVSRATSSSKALVTLAAWVQPQLAKELNNKLGFAVQGLVPGADFSKLRSLLLVVGGDRHEATVRASVDLGDSAQAKLVAAAANKTFVELKNSPFVQDRVTAALWGVQINDANTEVVVSAVFDEKTIRQGLAFPGMKK